MIFHENHVPVPDFNAQNVYTNKSVEALLPQKRPLRHECRHSWR